MTKPAYMVIGIDVHNEGAMGPYRVGTAPLLERYNGDVLAATDRIELVDGDWSRQRVVLIKFPSLKHANAFWKAPEYTPLRLLREDSSEQDNILVEGLMDETPGSAKAGGETPCYMLAAYDVTDAGWVDEYRAKVPPISAKYGLEALAATDRFETLDGSWPRQQFVLLKFPSEKAFKEFWADPAYQPFKEAREAGSEGTHIIFPGAVE